MPEEAARRFDRPLYLGAKFLAQAGQNLWLAALFIVAGTGTHPAVDLSSLFAAMVLPAVLFGLPGGALADRLGPARALAAGSVLRIVPVVVGLFFLDAGWVAWALAFAFSTGSQLFDPAEMALVRVFGRDHHGRIHSSLVAVTYAGQGIGMLVLAPLLYLAGGTGALVLGSAAALTLVSVVTGVLAWGLRDAPANAPVSAAAAMRFGEVFAYFRREVLARAAMVSLGLKMVVSRAIVVALPLYLERDLGVGVRGLTLLFIPGILGVVFGLWWCGRNVTLARSHEVIRWSIFGLATCLVAMAALDQTVAAAAGYSQVAPIARLEAAMNTAYILAFPVAFLLGLCLTGTHIAPRVALTETAPVGQHGRVFALQYTLTEAVIMIPLVLLGVGTTYAGARVTFGFLAGAVALALLLVELDRARALGTDTFRSPGTFVARVFAARPSLPVPWARR